MIRLDKQPPSLAIAPFNVGQAKKHLDEFARYLKIPAKRANSIVVKFQLMLKPPLEQKTAVASRRDGDRRLHTILHGMSASSAAE